MPAYDKHNDERTFEQRVEDFTGEDISNGSSPVSQTHLNQWVKDGVRDIVTTSIEMNPKNLVNFTKTTTLSNSEGVDLNGAKVVSVVRENGTSGSYEIATPLDPAKRYLATNVDSLNYRSKYNPVFYLLDKKVYVLPVPTSSNNNALITHSYYPEVDNNGVDLAYNSVHVEGFPIEKEQCLVLYIAIQVAQANITNIGREVKNLSLSVPDPVMPSAPADADIDFTSLPTFPGFVAPTFTAPTLADIPEYSVPPVPSAPTLDTVSGETIDLAIFSDIPTAPTFTTPTVAGSADELTDVDTGDAPVIGTDADFDDYAKFWTVWGEAIEDQVDTEISSAHGDKVKTYIQAYSTELQKQTTIFNKNKAKFDADVQKIIQEGQVLAQKYQKEGDQRYQAAVQNNNQKLQKYQAEVSAYGAELNAINQKYNAQELQKTFQKYLNDYRNLLQKYGSDLQVEQARLGNDVADYQAEFTKATQTYQAETGYDMQKYQAEVNAVIQQHGTTLNINIQQFQQELARKEKNYTWWFQMKQDWTNQYKEKMIGRPPAPPQQQGAK